MHEALRDISLIAWDLDGTLVDSAPDLALAVDRMLEHYGHAPVGVAAVRDWVGNGARALVSRALEHRRGSPLTEPAALDEALAVFMRAYEVHLVVHTRLYDGARACLEALHERGFQQVLITNKPERLIAPILEALAIEGFFGLCLGGDSLERRKPDPLPLLSSARRMGTLPANALMIGDSKSDVLAARAAGFRSLAVTYGYNHGEPIARQRPDWLLDSLGDLV